MNNKDRFRFKFYDKTTQFIGDVKSFDISSNYAMVRFSYANDETPDDEVNLSDGVLIQCTGLKDSKGVLIYEDDIIKGICSSNANDVCDGLKQRGLLGKEVTGIIRYSDSFGQFYFTDDDITFLHLYHGIEEMEVIGSIHKNPKRDNVNILLHEGNTCSSNAGNLYENKDLIKK